MVDALVERHAPGVAARDFAPGDFILTHRHHDFFTWEIGHAQSWRFRGADSLYAHWTHAALIVEPDGTLVEAEWMGVILKPISIYHRDEYHLVRLGSDFPRAARERIVAFAKAQVGQGFGYLDAASAALYLAFGRRVRWVRRNHVVCSALVCEALQEGGLLAGFEPALTLPADIARAFDVRP